MIIQAAPCFVRFDSAFGRRLAQHAAGRAACTLLVLGAAACAPCPCTAEPKAPPSPAAQLTCPKPALAAFAPKPLLIWDGEDANSRAKGWASCGDNKTDCTTSVEVKPGVGHDGSVGLEFKAKGPEWMGFGWNWFGWWPKTAGTDISKHKSLRFWIQVSGERGQKPEADSVRVSLSGSSRGGQDSTEAVPINEYAPGFSDGEWHEVVVPIEPMLHGKGERFDTYKAWAITIGAWNQGMRDYTIHVDQIEFI